MEVYPLKSINLERAIEFQFRLVDLIHRNFEGQEFLSGGDYGVLPGTGRPKYTEKVEKVITEFFSTEAAALVRGSGTGAIRAVLNRMLKNGESILLHNAPIYPTTKITIEAMGLTPVMVDFNNLSEIDGQLLADVSLVLIQHSRQKLEDNYNLGEVIKKLKELRNDLLILVDDNYVVMKAEKIGAQLGADASAFSMFKLLGPEGVGCVVGKKRLLIGLGR